MKNLVAIVIFLTSVSACDNPSAQNPMRPDRAEDPREPTSEDAEGRRHGSSKETSGRLRHTVMVIDDGFDSSLDIFTDKVVGEFTLVCDEGSPEDHRDFDKMSLREKKELYIESYSENDDGGCRVKEGIRFKVPRSFRSISKERQDWNEKVLNKRLGPRDLKSDLYETISGARDKRNFHGTNVASIIAYDNPEVRFVFVQIELAKSDDAIIEDDDECPKQRDIDDWVKIHRDKKVAAAYEKQPIGPIEKSLLKIAKRLKVSLVNMSFGMPPRRILEKSLKEAGCDSLDYRELYTLEGKLDRKMSIYRENNDAFAEYEVEALGVQAAGNDSSRIDSRADATDCSDRDNNMILVGSYDIERRRSDFSNHGKCVDFYNYGDYTVTRAPAGFLNAAAGTSFASPMTVRYLSKKLPPEVTVDEALRFLDKKADRRGFLPGEAYVEELAFYNDSAIKSYSLANTSASEERYLLDHRIQRAFRIIFQRGR